MAIIRCHFSLTESDEDYTVELRIDEGEAVSEELALELHRDARIWSVVHNIDDGDCSQEDLRDVGSQLWAGLHVGEVATKYDDARERAEQQDCAIHIRLDLPDRLQRLPWESLYDERRSGFLATDRRVCILRDIPAGIEIGRLRERTPGPLRVLVAIPDGSGLNVDHEWSNIKSAFEKLGGAVEVDRLDGRVTPDLLEETLENGDYDVFHFVGHGEFGEENGVSVRLNSEHSLNEEYWMEGETFAMLFQDRGIRLAVINCCQGADSSPTRSMSGLGPFLMRKGVPVVVAMRYEIPDEVSIKFSRVFYRELVGSSHTGQVWHATDRARAAVRRNMKPSTVRGFITPVLYQVADFETAFELEPETREDVKKPVPRRGSRRIELPNDLVEAVEQGRCVPVIGPGVLKIGAVRSQNPPTGPRQLAEKLAGDTNYPRMDDFTFSERAGDWADTLVLQWVCQFFEAKERRFKLIEQIQSEYRGATPNDALLALASWKVPGHFYCHFDGLLEEAFAPQEHSPLIVNLVDHDPDSELGGPLLVNLCGTWADDRSLVLTEIDHDQLMERLKNMTVYAERLMTDSLGRSLLFLGVHPRDPLVKALCNNLLKSELARNRGPLFFACSEYTEVDDAYWTRYDVQWIAEDLELIIEELTDLAGGAAT